MGIPDEVPGEAFALDAGLHRILKVTTSIVHKENLDSAGFITKGAQTYSLTVMTETDSVGFYNGERCDKIESRKIT